MGRAISLFFISVFLLVLPAGCGQAPTEPDTQWVHFECFREIPGITPEEIEAVEAFIAAGHTFVYGALYSIEAFFNYRGEISGFTALFSEWLHNLFGIPFDIRFFEWDTLKAGLEDFSIDFTGELTSTAEREKTHFMTDAIGARMVGYFRLENSLPLSQIAYTRPVRYAFLYGAVTSQYVYNRRTDVFESFYVKNYAEAYALLRAGIVDAFIEERLAEVAFDVFDGIVVEDFSPFIYSNVSLATRNPANAPIISIVQRALAHGSIHYMTEMYNQGMHTYLQHKFYSRLSEKERYYLANRGVVRFLAEHDNYPMSFYNIHEHTFQGISHDVIREISALTGLYFELVNDNTMDRPEVLHMLETGEAAMVTELIRIPEREGRFLWTHTAIATDHYALISTRAQRSVRFHEIFHMRIGLVEGYAQTVMFKNWFPGHRYTVMYNNFDHAFIALGQGEVDLVMGSQNQLLVQTNFRGHPDYKVNFVFNYIYNSTFGFYRNEYVLMSIIDTALQLIDTYTIEHQWMRKTYDYRVQLARQQLNWFIFALVMVLFIMVIIVALIYMFKNKQELEEKSRFKSRFLATVSHEIRTPMNAIIGIAQIQLQKDELPDEYAASLETIYDSGNTMLNIINDILDLSKIETGKLDLHPAVYNIPAFISETVHLNSMRIGTKPVEFKLHVEPNLPGQAIGDELRLKQILNNLLSNAIKYTNSGYVKLSLTHSKEDEDLFLHFLIEDTGQGLKPEDQSRLYSEYLRFNTEANRKTEGTGIGLNITKSLVDMMDGTITLDSVYGKGSIFEVTVKQKPVNGPTIGEEQAAQLCNFTFVKKNKLTRKRLNRTHMSYGRVLVVDDVETNLFVARGLLAPYDLDVETALSGFEAIENINNGNTYDIIFMDHMMPRMDGIETTQKLRKNGYTGTIIALTANALVGSDDIFAQNGFDGFIAKPIDLNRLNEVLNKFIRDRHPTVLIQQDALEMKKKIRRIFRKDAEKAVTTLKSRDATMKQYITAVHSMKSALANIDETAAADTAARLEEAGLEKNTVYIDEYTPGFIALLEEIISEIDATQHTIDDDSIIEDVIFLNAQLKIIKIACEIYDAPTIYAALDVLKTKQWRSQTVTTLEKMRESLYSESDFESVGSLASALL